MYGCTSLTTMMVTGWLGIFGGQALHPLVLPLIFAEVERKRLFNVLDRKQTDLRRWILDLEDKLRAESKALTSKKNGTQVDSRSRDCQSTKLWVDVSSLKNGLESLRDQLAKMIDHSEDLARTIFKPPAEGEDKHVEERKTGERIKIRLSEMIAEFESKVRSCESLLGGMALAAQMVSPCGHRFYDE